MWVDVAALHWTLYSTWTGPNSVAVQSALAFPIAVFCQWVDLHHGGVQVSEDTVQLEELVYCLLVVRASEAKGGSNLCSLLLCQT